VPSLDDHHLFILPGLDGSGNLYDALQTHLDPQLKVRALAYPPDKQLSLNEYAQFITEQVGRKQNLVLLAESFGGLVALEILRQQQLRPAAIIFSACFAEPPHPLRLNLLRLLPEALRPWHRLPDIALRWAGYGHSASAGDLETGRKALDYSSTATLNHRLELIANYHPPEFTLCKLPCLYLQAERDHLVPSHCSDWFSQHFAPFMLKRLQGSHFLLQTRPQEAARNINEFIYSLIR
jgi:surfactin synthase thioesterase subunit